MVNVEFDNTRVKRVQFAFFRRTNKFGERIVFYDTDKEIQSKTRYAAYNVIDIGIDNGMIKCLYNDQNGTTVFNRMFPINRIDEISVYNLIKDEEEATTLD